MSTPRVEIKSGGRGMGYRLILAGLLFFANPNVNIIDIAPDFIGCVLIIAGLSRLRDLSTELSEARRKCFPLFWLSLAKLLALYLTLVLLDEGFLLVFSFCFSVAELWLMLSMFRSLYGGFFMLSVRCDSDSTASGIDRARKMSYIFVVARCILLMLPELSYLYINEDYGYVLVPFKGVLILLCLIAAIIFGVFYILRTVKFFGVVRRDEGMVKRAEELYTSEVLTDTKLFIRRRLRTGLAFIGAACLLFTDFYFDGMNILPDIAGALCVLYALISWRRAVSAAPEEFPDDRGRVSRLYFPAMAVAAVYIPVTAVSTAFANYYAGKYYFIGLRHSMEAYREFGTAVIAAGVEALCFALLIIFTASALNAFTRMCTGRLSRHGQRSMEEREEDTRKKERLGVIFWMIGGLLVAAAEFAMRILLYIAPAWWMADLALHIVWAFAALELLSWMREKMETKFM